MIIIAFFFLLCPGEYTNANSDTTPFTLGNVQLSIGNRRLPLATATAAVLNQARTASLTFTTQKNGVENEVIRHFLSGDPYICVVKAVIRCVCHLRSNNAPASTPLSQVYVANGSRTQLVTPTLITKVLRGTVTYLGADLGFLPAKISACSLRAAGTMSLLVAQVDTNNIQILGRWRSDKMFRYLHLTAEPIMKQFASKMLNADYTLAPSQLVPCH